MLDDVSTVCLIDQKLANELGVKGFQKGICLQWTNNELKQHDDSRIVNFIILSSEGRRSFNLRNVRTITDLALLNYHPTTHNISILLSFLV